MEHALDNIELSTEAALHPLVFAAAFNSGDPDQLERVYTEDAVFVTPNGAHAVGEDRRLANREFQALRIPIQVEVRQVHEYGDLALLVVDWTIDGEGSNGRHVHLNGTATDVAQRGADGRWRYIIDNPFGVDAGR